MVCVTVRAECGLGDAPSIYLYQDCVGAHIALEEGLSHLGYKGAGADNHASNGDQLIDICKYNDRELVLKSLHTDYCLPGRQMATKYMYMQQQNHLLLYENINLEHVCRFSFNWSLNILYIH